ncbi:hypothetical protein [Celeribacter sp. SCSIO 80788]|jgi:hypothetical protein|uniref:hypothetical protein n=1 Tax=Celeribacter sp. SCSIO 80788 TaxID=3117013 RepID=UPI003DA5B2E9
MKLNKPLTKPMIALLLALTATPALAAPTGNNGQGFGVGEVPPGHQKKQLPSGYVIIDDYAQYNLPAPNGFKYAKHDGKIVKIDSDTMQVIATVGLISALLGN